MVQTIDIRILSPEKNVYNGPATCLTLSTEAGVMQVLPRHASMFASILFTHAKLETAEGSETFLIKKGILRVDNATNSAVILASYVELETEVNITTAKEYLALISQQLERGESLGKFHLQFLEEERLVIERQLQTTQE